MWWILLTWFCAWLFRLFCPVKVELMRSKDKLRAYAERPFKARSNLGGQVLQKTSSRFEPLFFISSCLSCLYVYFSMICWSWSKLFCRFLRLRYANHALKAYGHFLRNAEPHLEWRTEVPGRSLLTGNRLCFEALAIDLRTQHDTTCKYVRVVPA